MRGQFVEPDEYHSMEHEVRKYHSSVRTAMDTSSVLWGTIAYKLKDFHKYFELPQLVRVEDGYYDEKDETTLSRDDILTLHILQKTRFFKAVDKNGQEINIPVSLAAKVETVPEEATRTCHSIEELIHVSADRVKSVHDHPWLLIRAGDTLQIREENDDREVESLRFSFLSRQQRDVNIPISYKADFQVLPVITKLWLTEVEKTFELPVRIRFTDESLQIKGDEDEAGCEDFSTIADLGDVTLQSIYQKEQYVASTRNENRTMVLKIPVEADITIKAGVGIEEGDYTYVEVCQFYHDRARLYQLEEIDEDCIKIGETDAKVERIYEFVDELSDEDDDPDYEDPLPKLPSRAKRPPLHPVNNNSDEDDDDDDDDDGTSDDEGDDYEEYEVPETLPPPVPTRITSLQQNTNNNQSLCARIVKALCCLRSQSENLNNSTPKADTDTFEVPTDVARRYVEPEATIRGNPARSNAAFEGSEDDNAVVTFPERLDLLSVEEVCLCLRGLNMENYVDQFKKEQINGGLLVALTDDLLISLGVTSEFHRKKLSKFIQGWRPDQNAAQN